MRQVVRATIEVLTVASFAGSILAESLRTDIKPLLLVGSSGTDLGRTGLRPSIRSPLIYDDVISIIQQPTNGALWALLAAVLICCVIFLALRTRARFAPPVPALVLLGMCAAAVWPWIVSASPSAGLASAALAPLGVIAGLRQERDLRLPYRGEVPMAFIAGWLLIAGIGAVALLLHVNFHLQAELAALIGLLAAALIGARVQLSLGSNVGFSGAIIWAMLGIATASLEASMTIATACVLGIAAMVVVLVRVTT